MNDFNMNMHDNLLNSFKEEQMAAERKTKDFKDLLYNYIFILHLGYKLTKAFNLSVNITNHVLKVRDVLKDKVVVFIEKNKGQIDNENSQALINSYLH